MIKFWQKGGRKVKNSDRTKYYMRSGVNLGLNEEILLQPWKEKIQRYKNANIQGTGKVNILRKKEMLGNCCYKAMTHRTTIGRQIPGDTFQNSEIKQWHLYVFVKW